MCDSPVWGGGAVHVVIPVADSEFLVEARLVAAHVGNPATVLITHVEYLGKENVAFIQKAKLFLRQMIFTDAFVHIFDVKEHCLVAVLNVLFAF